MTPEKEINAWKIADIIHYCLYLMWIIAIMLLMVFATKIGCKQNINTAIALIPLTMGAIFFACISLWHSTMCEKKHKELEKIINKNKIIEILNNKKGDSD